MSNDIARCVNCRTLTSDLEGNLCHSCRPAEQPRCQCGELMICDDVDSWTCENLSCPQSGDSFTLSEIDNRNEAAGVRSQRTGAEAFDGGFAENH